MSGITKAQPIGNGKPVSPTFAPRAWPYTFLFATVGQATLQLAQSIADVGLDNVQTVFIDNSNNNSPVSLRMADTGEICVCPPYSQGFFPILFSGLNLNVTGASAGVVDVPVKFLNIAMDAVIWSVSSPQGTGVQTIQGTVSVAPTPGAFTDRSGAVTTGGTSQQMMAANGARKRLVIKNPASIAGQNIAAAESLFINFTGPAGVNDGVSFELQPGEGYDTATGPCPTQAVTVTAPTNAHRWIAKEM